MTGEEPPVNQVSDLADILKLELKYEQMRKEQKETKDDSEETEVSYVIPCTHYDAVLSTSMQVHTCVCV